MPKIVVDEKRCKGCERCVDACPQGVIAMSKKLNEKGYFYAVPVYQPQAPALAALSRRVKDSFDPKRVLNPGRMYEGV